MSADAVARKWHDLLISSEPVDHDRAEAAVRAAYRAAGMVEPARFLWCASPLEGAWATLVIIGKSDGYNHAVIEDVERSKGGKAKLAEVRARVAERLGVREDEIDGRFGKPFYRAEGNSRLGKRLQDDSAEAWMARAEAGDDFLATHARGPFKPLYDLEQSLHFEGYKFVGGRQTGSLFTEAIEKAGPKPVSLLAKRSALHRLYGNIAFSEVAVDEALAEAGQLQPTDLQRAIWAAYEACGMWWPCETGVVFAERPVAAELTADGPRLAWADGFTVGGPPSALPMAAMPAPAPPPPVVRSAASGADAPTPFLDRYLAGEHEQVWKELMALGPEALGEEHAADARAVAYETMQRVARNLRTLADRLDGLGYRFVDPASGGLFGIRKPKPHQPLLPPGPDSAERIAELESVAGGPVPLSLQAFFDVVGQVNFIGEHEALAPRGSADADPLFVHGVEDGIDCVASWGDADDEEKMFVVAPDALHKANVSGGDPYMIAVPAAVADAPLEEEPHGVTFVEYLRIAILRWGGFPGWDQARSARPELDSLRDGLIPF